MTLEMAVLLLVVAVAGIVLLSLIALALAVYIGLVFILLDAIQHQPPAP